MAQSFVQVSGEDQAEYLVASDDFTGEGATGAAGASSLARASMPGIIEKVLVKADDLVSFSSV